MSSTIVEEVYASEIFGSSSCTEDHPQALTKLCRSARSRYFYPLESSIDTTTSPNFFETSVNKVINDLGKFRLKKMESNLLMTFYMIKLQCKVPRFEYETIIVGDEFDEEDDARENAFLKAYEILWSKFRQEMVKLEKVQNKNFPPRLGITQYYYGR